MQGKSDPNRELLDAAALCRQLVPEGSVEAFLADHRRKLFPDEMFADLFASARGRPSIPADVVATVMVLQALEGLSDREAARALRDRISWKVAAGLALDDEGFDYSVLTYWRTRLRASADRDRIFEAVRAAIRETGALSGRNRRALDSTILDDAVATQDTVTQLISAVRRVRRLVPQAAAVEVTAHDYDHGAKPLIAWDDPVAKGALITALVDDALALIAALDGLALSDEQADAVGLLALVAGQDVEPGETPASWRIAQRVAPDRVISTVDPEARHARKSPSQRRDGFKAHIAVEPESGLITDARLSAANVSDAAVAVGLVEGEDEAVEVLADSAYGSGPTRAALAAKGHRSIIKPIPLRPAVPGGLSKADFTIDVETNSVTCPAGHTVTFGRGLTARFGTFCHGCPLRARCTRAKGGKVLKVNLYEPELAEARTQAATPEFAAAYRSLRPMAERAISWLVAKGNRRVPYRGIARNDQWIRTRAAAINLRTLVRRGLDHDGGWVFAT